MYDSRKQTVTVSRLNALDKFGKAIIIECHGGFEVKSAKVTSILYFHLITPAIRIIMRKARGSARDHMRGQSQSRGRGRVNTPLHVKDPNAAFPHIQMEHIASVSRSSGLEKGGDA